MKINDLLTEKRPRIIKKWFDAIINTYPGETSTFLKNLNNPLNNPSGSIIQEGIEGLFDEINNSSDLKKAVPFLDSIIRLRAVQDFTPSQAVSFTTILKKVIREELSSDIRKDQLFEELLELESKIDRLTDLAFDIYMECREKLFKIRTKEVKDMTHRLIQRANQADAYKAKNRGA
jgi:hypothetical protein